ncbi:MAG: argininosuccinate lyase [Bacillota bacterium]
MDSEARNRPLWGGRFSSDPGAASRAFTSSISFDHRLYREDIRVNRAHARTLKRAGIIEVWEMEEILRGLDEVEEMIESGRASLSPEYEDIHTNVEMLLAGEIGQLARKLHTGRSRNDQVAADMHLYVLGEVDEIAGLLRGLQWHLHSRAGDHVNTLMPGYTHTQRAQPVSLAHHLMAYFWMFQRDRGRFADCRRRADESPLGAAALAGSGFDLDRSFAADQLGFSRTYPNSIDAVSDRDFVLEFLSAAATTMMHLSRLATELILWSGGEYGFASFPESYSTGSSIMPQKRNPDSAELIRGKTGRVYGSLMALLGVMKGLPLAYNSDMQEDKEALFDASDTLRACLEVASGIISSLTFHPQRMLEAATGGFSTATDVADYLVGRGMAFRDAHRLVGEIVAHCEASGKELVDLTPGEWEGFSDLFEGDMADRLTPRGSVNLREISGGTGPEAVREQLSLAQGVLEED